ncbi:hypothetical protein Glove_701g15 [Diversispora epigaea]|uniref:HD1-like protein n=1 Tax=Diversispora epigaea TaxID=1348612 RepID=A0A397G1S9_9GLOM|nr:hypothetical protein Glove_701g15 [Diversispora epigaea]
MPKEKLNSERGLTRGHHPYLDGSQSPLQKIQPTVTRQKTNNHSKSLVKNSDYLGKKYVESLLQTPANTLLQERQNEANECLLRNERQQFPELFNSVFSTDEDYLAKQNEEINSLPTINVSTNIISPIYIDGIDAASHQIQGENAVNSINENTIYQNYSTLSTLSGENIFVCSETESFSDTKNKAVDHQNLNEHPLHLIYLKLLNLRDLLYVSQVKDEFLDIVENLTEQALYAFKIPTKSELDTAIHTFIPILIQQLIDICNKELELGEDFLKFHAELEEKTEGIIQTYCTNHQKDFQDPNPAISCLKTQHTRQQTDPFSTMWFIKYLLDNDLQRPDKKQRNWLSLWTNMMLHDVNRWFIRTNNNYIKKNEKETARKKLTERAKITSKQLRNTFKAKNKMSSKRSQPYDKGAKYNN